LWQEPEFWSEAEPKENNRDFWSAIAQLGEPIIVRPGAKVELTLPDKTVDVERLAATWAMPLENGTFAAH
jgi:hypothetical protein